VITYFVEHRLASGDRETIATDLMYLSDEDFSKIKTSYVDFSDFFQKDKAKFKEFAKYMGL
jgi:hypothetical protein